MCNVMSNILTRSNHHYYVNTTCGFLLDLSSNIVSYFSITLKVWGIWVCEQIELQYLQRFIEFWWLTFSFCVEQVSEPYCRHLTHLLHTGQACCQASVRTCCWAAVTAIIAIEWIRISEPIVQYPLFLHCAIPAIEWIRISETRPFVSSVRAPSQQLE